jgi:GntR family transcriptional regulator / MocR family aminotransferase
MTKEIQPALPRTAQAHSRSARSLDLALPPRRTSMPAYRWLYAALRSEILSGHLHPGTRLPATRDLARQYALARGTIVNAFEQLRSEGYIEGAVGSGTFVSKVLPEALLDISHHRPENSAPARRTKLALSSYAQRATLFPGYEPRPTRAFRANLPALDLFPIALWAKITARCLRRVSTRHLMGSDPSGYMPLRQAIADHLSRSRGVRCQPQQVAIVSGAQQALDLAARLLIAPGDRVCMESPGYPGAALVFQAFRAKLVPAGIDSEGVIVRSLPRRSVRLIYVTPGHQFPLGTTMSLARRLELLAWARQSGALIFEDDYDSEYRYSGRPIPALQGLDNAGRVLYAGSFNKVLFPALRLGYLVLPPSLVDRVAAIQSLTARHAPVLEQFILSEFIREGHFQTHLRRMRQIYAERLAVLMEQARSRLSGLLEISPVEAGLQTVGWLAQGIGAESAAMAAARRQIDVTPLTEYSYSPATRKAASSGLQLGFAAIPPAEIRRGIRELAIALESIRKPREK